jgi:hypothetical protein
MAKLKDSTAKAKTANKVYPMMRGLSIRKSSQNKLKRSHNLRTKRQNSMKMGVTSSKTRKSKRKCLILDAENKDVDLNVEMGDSTKEANSITSQKNF